MYYNTMTNVLYIHGYASNFKPDSEKMQHLASEFNLSGVDVDYSLGFDSVEACVREAVVNSHVDLLIGTSMGGYTAQRLGPKFGLPWVAINPAVDAKQVMIDKGHSDVADSFDQAKFDGSGLVLLDRDDEVFDSLATYTALPNRIQELAVMYPGGDHRFQHMKQAVQEIKTFWRPFELVYGLSF